MISHMWNLMFKNDTIKLIYKIEIDSQIFKKTYGYKREKIAGRDK